MTLLCFVTCKDEEEAKKISKSLLEKKLVACASIVPKIESAYRWKGKLESSSEALLILKTRKGLKEEVMAEVKKLHSYELPVIEFVEAGSEQTVEEWVEEETK